MLAKITLQKNHRLYLFFIALVTLLALPPCLKNNFVFWDDPQYIVSNPSIVDLNWKNVQHIFSGFVMGNYQPLTVLTYALEYHWAGPNPIIYHSTNLVLHLFNTLLVYFFVMSLTKQPVIAFITSLFFGIHPMRVESVAWATERKDVLFVFFYILSLICYVKTFKDNKDEPFPERANRFRYGFAFIFFLLSLLSKPSAVSLPFAVFMIDYAKHGQYFKKALTFKILMVITAFLFGLIALYGCYFKQSQGVYLSSLIFNFSERFLLSFYALGFYIQKLFFPFSITAFYGLPKPSLFLYLIVPVLYCLGFILIWAWAKKDRMILFGLLFFHGTILLNLPWIGVGHTLVADRFTYLPYLGLSLLVGIFCQKIYERVEKNHPSLSPTLRILFLFIVTGFVLLTQKQCLIWKNDFTLWNDVIKKQPSVYLAYFHRANWYALEDENLPLAIDDLSRAITLFPRDSEVFYQRASLYLRMGKPKKALQDLNYAISIEPKDARFYSARELVKTLIKKMPEGQVQ